MAAGIRVLPGPPALQPMRADQATADQGTAAGQEPTGPEMVAQTPPGGWATGAAKTAGSLPPDVGVPAAGLPSRGWGGSGGRWLIWVFRAVLWTALLLIAYRGLAAIVTGQPVSGGAPGTVQAPAGRGSFPVSLARAYALAFGQVYLNYNPAGAGHRAAELATFLPPGADQQLGWNGSGAQRLQFEQVAGVRVLNRHRAVVTLLARAGGHLIELAVPVYAVRGGMVVSGRPALLPPPSNIALPPPRSETGDPAAKLALKRMLPGFFRAYATGDAIRLAAFTPHGTVITGLGSVVTFGGLVNLIVPAEAGQVRHVLATVAWRPVPAGAQPGSGSSSPVGGQASPAPGATAPADTAPGGGTTSPAAVGPVAASVQMTYALTVVRHAGSWLVRSIGPAAAQPWPSP